MLRTAFVLVALALSPIALACGDGDCTGNCQMKPTTAALDDVDAATGTKAAFSVSGMRCGSCADKIVAALKGVAGVNAATVDVTTGAAKVAFDESKTNLDALLTVVNGLGHFEAKKNAS